MTTAEKILSLIQERGIEQQKLATYLGIKKQTISDWKSGKTKSYTKYIDKIAEYFNVSTDYLLGNETEEEQLDTIDQEILVLMRKTRDLPTDDKKKFLEVIRGSVNAFIREDNK